MKHDLPKLVMFAWGGSLLKDFVSLNNLFFSLICSNFPPGNAQGNFTLVVRCLTMPIPCFHQEKGDHH
jgi:hypothetical protein